MSGVYDRLGVPVLINALGTNTRLSGGVMHPDVAAAMAEATGACVDMATLQGAASGVIARITGAQAGIVTSGASAAVLLGAAACLAGLDPGRMNALPAVADGRDGFVVVRSQRNMYDRAVVVAGGRIIEVGIADRYSGPGVRDAAAWELADAVGPTTAGIYYLAQPQSRPPLAEVAAVARAAGVPLLVDAAAQLPPAANLRAFIDQGADLVAFSGGKAIGGPQASGILCGRADLVASALVQMLDLDVEPAGWTPPPAFAALAGLRGLPHHGIGRSCKVGKEAIVGLLAALERFAATTDAQRDATALATLEAVIAQAPGAGLRIVPGPALELPGDAALADALEAGSPPVVVSRAGLDRGVLRLSAAALGPGQARALGRRLAGLQDTE